MNPIKPKIFLVSDAAQFALTDVYYGYVHAFQKLGVDVVAYPLHQFLQHHREHICYSVIHSEALIKENGYTHVIFIGGLSIPPRLLESFHGVVKTIIVATEDPHTFDPLKNSLEHIDYYFTNERSVSTQGLPGVHYLPTAADPVECGFIPAGNLDPKYLSDILFLGAIYPNREKMLRSIIPVVKRYGLNLKILGHPQYLDKKSPLWEFIPPENYDSKGNLITIEHDETIKYYNGSKAVLNFFRDVKWNPTTSDKSNPFNSSDLPPESMNPRAYEVPLCGSFMLLEDTRVEAREVFSDDQVGFFSNAKQLRSQIVKYIVKRGSDDLRKSMARSAFVKVSANHTYIQRAQKLLRVLGYGE